MAKGYISIHRKIWDNDIWKSKEPFDVRSAWIDLLLMANHADNESIRGKSIIKLKRGQLHTSYGHLAKRWGWSVNKVRRYLRLLNELGMVHIDSTPNGTSLTLVNYGVYQDRGHTFGITKSTTNDTTNETTNGTLTIMNNNNNVTNNVSNKYNKRRSRQTDEDIDNMVADMKRKGML